MAAKEEIRALTGLRGVAALWVLAYHARALGRELSDPAFETFRWLAGAGYLGVDVFFVLSGFVLAYCYANERVHGSIAAYGGFLWKRLARIYPVHLFCLALMAVGLLALSAAGIPFHRPRLISLEGLLDSVMLVHAWGLPVRSTWNTVSWSISSEWAAYLVFPLLALSGRLLKRPLHAASVTGVLVLLLWMVVEARPWPNGMAYGVPRIGCAFAAGVVLFRGWELAGRKPWPHGGTVAALGIAAMALGGAWLEARQGHLAALPFALPVACLIVLGLASGDRGRVIGMLSGRPANFLGRISYSLYMVHGMVFMFARSASIEFGWTGSSGPIWALAFAGSLIALLLAVGIYSYVEVPCRRGLVAWWGRRQGARAAVKPRRLRSAEESTGA